MPATIKDVARRARCSIASVSRVVNRSGASSAALRARVERAVRELGFRPSAAGRNLARQRCDTIGVLVPSLTNPVFAACLTGLQDAARQGGHSVVIAQSDYDPARELAAAEALMAERPRGLVLTLCNPGRSRVLALARAARVRAILLFNEPPRSGEPVVTVDNRRAGADIATALVAAGHRRIAFVSGRFAASDRARARYHGLAAALKRAGIAVPQPIEVDFITGAEDIDLDAAFAQGRPSAIVASNDLLAIGVVAALRQRGLKVPADVSVAGFDGIAIGRLIAPSLTTIEWPARQMGAAAAQMLLDPPAKAARRARVLRLPHRFHPGGSLAAAPTSTRSTRRADR